MRNTGDRNTGAPGRLVARALVAVMVAAAATSACGGADEEDAVQVGLLLSYTGHGATVTINSERAVLMAFEAANAGGGVGGRPVRALARDTGSDPTKVQREARQLLDAGVPIFIGPDSNDLAIATRALLGERTVVLPSFATAAATDFKTPSWFVMGVTIGRVSCELMAELRADGRKSPTVIYNPTGYSASLSSDLGLRYGVPKIVFPEGSAASADVLDRIRAAKADSFVLAADAPSAISLVFGLLATGAIDPTRWYLSPALRTPVLLESLPRGALVGAHGAGPGTAPEGPRFAAEFARRWHEPPLEDAYSFYDAGALAVLSLQHALVKEGAIPKGGGGLDKHLVAVTRPGGVPVAWNELAQGLAHLRAGEEITYHGVSGALDFDVLGYARGALTSWWTIRPEGFTPIDGRGDCQ